MSLNFSKTLWSNPDRSRFFLIPDDRQLPAGDFELKTVTGCQQQVEASAIVEFEISRDEAKIWLKEQFGELLTSVKTGILDTLKNWRSPVPSSKPETDSPSSTSRTEAALSELDNLLNQSAEQLRTQSTHSLEHLKAIAIAFHGMLNNAIASEPEQLTQAKEHAQVLQDHLQALGLQTDIRLDTFPERLHHLYFAEGRGQHLLDNADQLEAIADQIENTSQLAVKSIRVMARYQQKQGTQSPDD